MGMLVFFLLQQAMAGEHSIKGLVDIRAHVVDSNANVDSYLTGDYGKFRFNDEAGIALGQLGLQYHGSFDHNLSVKVVANAFADEVSTEFGLTEAFIQYKSLPSASGWRFKGKLGIFYPLISLENNATAWSTVNTITSSTLNNWVGEEFRHAGVAFSFEKLGKFVNSPHNLLLDVSLFQNNDTAGAMLTWHGWALGSRQTLLQEKLTVQKFPARYDLLSAQAAHSDPFVELDDRWGGHIVGQWQVQNKFKLNLGYYNNNAEKGLVKQGQYTWTTDFIHGGLKYKLAKGTELIAQFMTGNTLMTSPLNEKVVYNDFDNAFVLLRKQFARHQISTRIEVFSVDDLDDTVGDNNNEDGHAFTLSYRYQLNRQQYLLAEYNWLSSERKSRAYQNQAEGLIEEQYQIAYRYYF